MEQGYAEKAAYAGAVNTRLNGISAGAAQMSATSQAVPTLEAVATTAAALANYAEQLLTDAWSVRGRLTGDYPPPTNKGAAADAPRQPLLLELSYHQQRLYATLESLQVVGQQLIGALG